MARCDQREIPETADITAALRSLGAFASGIIPSHIRGPEVTMDDAREIQNDLLLLANKVDAVIEAYGIYLEQNGVLSAGDVRDCFLRQTFGALDGNALYLIESGTQDRIEGLAEAAIDHQVDLRRSA